MNQDTKTRVGTLKTIDNGRSAPIKPKLTVLTPRTNEMILGSYHGCSAGNNDTTLRRSKPKERVETGIHQGA
jgi:hypothetical protein